MITRRQMIKGAAASTLLAGFPLAVDAAGAHVETGPAFGSAWRLVLASAGDARAACKAVEAVVERIDKAMSPFRMTSELAAFNAATPAQQGVSVSADTSQVLSLALDIAKASDGAFDPTCAPISRRFGYGTTRISASRPAGLYAEIRLAGRQLTSSTAGLSLDLCASAKGHALDQMARDLDGLDFLLELGGEIASRGRHPSGRPWLMGIERPGSYAVQRIIAAGSDVLATSANGQEGYRFHGRSYGHVIDPGTAKPVDNGVASVSVLAETGLLADSLATAALVLGPERATPLLKAYQARALFLMNQGPDLKEINLFGFTKGEA